MASRENQGYLIAVIVLVLLSLVLALTAFLGISKMNEYAQYKEAAENNLSATQKLLQANEVQSSVLKSMIGVGESTIAEIPTQISMLEQLPSQVAEADKKKTLQDLAKDLADIRTAYEKAVRSGAAGKDGDSVSFLAAIDNLNSSLAKMNVEYRVKENQSLLEEQEAQRKIKEMEAQVKKAEEEKQLAEADLNTEKDARRSDQTAHQTAMNESTARLQKANDDFERARERLNQELTSSKTEEARLKENNDSLTAKVVEYTREVFDRADGQVVKVFSNSNLVFIDIGRVHGISPNHSFAIYDQSTTNFEKGKEKGSIEITRILDNQSEARITYENPNNPILPGDWVLTPTWDPGQRVRFAMAGVFDLDGDGYSDLTQLKQMIERNGGEVVCWHDDAGQIQGKIDATVRFLALGDAPNLGINANPAVVAAMKTLKNEAEANTIQVIDKQKLLQRMGIRAHGKMELINKDVRERGFQPRTPPGASKEE